MSADDAPGSSRNSNSTRFRKGQSGNPAGRPRKVRVTPPAASAFDIVMDRTLTIQQGHQRREMTIDEALQHKTYQDAIAGNRAARRAVLKMISQREQALKARQPRVRYPTPQHTIERTDPDNAHEALLILGVAAHDSRWSKTEAKEHLLLERWAVQAAIDRRGRKLLTDAQIWEVERCTREANLLVWGRHRS